MNMPWRLVFQFGPKPTVDDSMSGWGIFGVVLAVIAVYLFISAIAQKIGEHDMDRDGPMGLLWPIGLPWFLGELAADSLKKLVTRPSNLPEARTHKE